MAKPLFSQVSIVGLGLIGGSLGMALRRGRVARRVIGFSRREATIRQAISRGAVHDGDTELCPEWLGQSQLVVLATPPEAVVPTARKIASLTKHSFVMTDVASVKSEIVRKLEAILPKRISFVGGHPMAGSERSGIEAAEKDLFRGAACVLTRTARTDPRALQKLRRMWSAAGGRVEILNPERHDALVAEVSHLPHLAAVALTLAPTDQALKLAGGGFTDMTRVALSDPRMWKEIVGMNSKEIARALGQLIKGLGKLKGSSVPPLFNELRKAQRRRRALSRS